MQINGSSTSVLNTGLQGLQKAQREIAGSAQQIAELNIQPEPQSGGVSPSEPVPQTQQVAETQDVVEPLVNLKRKEQLFNASAQIVKTADETLGSLLDVKA